MALLRKEPAVAMDRLRAAASLELGFVPLSTNISCLYVVHLRGEAYLAANRDFFALWKDADADIPILKQAQAEYAKPQ